MVQRFSGTSRVSILVTFVLLVALVCLVYYGLVIRRQISADTLIVPNAGTLEVTVYNQQAEGAKTDPQRIATLTLTYPDGKKEVIDHIFAHANTTKRTVEVPAADAYSVSLTFTDQGSAAYQIDPSFPDNTNPRQNITVMAGQSTQIGLVLSRK
jgi:hypothetical protein